MSTTVTYKGSTIATVNNNTKTLTTAGKYLEADVVLTDVSGGGETWDVIFDDYATIEEDEVNFICCPTDEEIGVGDVFRVTWNGVTTTLVARYVTIYGATYAVIGNPVSEGSEYDDGSGLTYYAFNYNGSNIVFGTTENPRTIELKIEKKINVAITWEVVYEGQVDIVDDWGNGNYYALIPWTETIEFMSKWRVIWDGTPFDLTANWEGSPDGLPYAIGNAGYDGGEYSYEYLPFLMQGYWGTHLAIVSEYQETHNVLILKAVTDSDNSNEIEDALITGSLVGKYSNSRVATIGAMAFYDNSKITAVDFPNVLNINDGDAFAYCIYLKSVSFPNATYIGENAFENCTNLIEASFPNVTSLGDSAFARCRRLASISFPHLNSMRYYAFSGCESLTEATFPELPILGDYAFDYCSRLETVSLPVATTIGVMAFSNCRLLSSVYAPNLTNISNNAFMSCYNLQSVEFPYVTKVGTGVFMYCSNLTTVSLPRLESAHNNMFAGCINLSTVYMPSISSIGYSCFQSCSNLTSVSFSNVTDMGENAFRQCSNLSFVSLPKLKSIGYSAFQNCTGLSSVYFPSVSSVGNYAFASCYNLQTISFPELTYLATVPFQYCSKLSSVYLPKALSIGQSAFQYCSNLTTVSLPKVSSINNTAFRNCVNLISLYFTGGSLSSVPKISASTFYSTPIAGYSTVAGRYGSIFVPASLYNAFSTAQYWSAYKSRMVSV